MANLTQIMVLYHKKNNQKNKIPLKGLEGEKTKKKFSFWKN